MARARLWSATTSVTRWEISLYLGSSPRDESGALGRAALPVKFPLRPEGAAEPVRFRAVSSYIWSTSPPTLGEMFDEEPMVSFIAIEGGAQGGTERSGLQLQQRDRSWRIGAGAAAVWRRAGRAGLSHRASAG